MAVFLLPTICWILRKWPYNVATKIFKADTAREVSESASALWLGSIYCSLSMLHRMLNICNSSPVFLSSRNAAVSCSPVTSSSGWSFAWVALSCLPLLSPVPMGLSRGLYKMNASCEWLSKIIKEGTFLCSSRGSR